MSESCNIRDKADAVLLKETLVGRSIVSIRQVEEDLTKDEDRYYSSTTTPQGEITLDDGTVLILAGNEGGCACSAGCYYLNHLNLDVVGLTGIMNVEVEGEGSSDDDYESNDPFRIFIIDFSGQRAELASFEGSDGNGYYGGGFWVTVKRAPRAATIDFRIAAMNPDGARAYTADGFPTYEEAEKWITDTIASRDHEGYTFEIRKVYS